MNSNTLHKVSIIVPVFNAANSLQRCLNSIVKQTLDDYEVIVINDGSCDESLTIAKNFSDKYPFVKVINQPNKGLFYSPEMSI